MAPRPYIDDPPKKKLFILCGSHREYDFWYNRIRRKTNKYDVIYAHEAMVIRGYREESFIRLGNWFNLREDRSELLIELMRHAEFTELHYSDIFGFESEDEERNFYETGTLDGYPVEF